MIRGIRNEVEVPSKGVKRPLDTVRPEGLDQSSVRSGLDQCLEKVVEFQVRFENPVSKSPRPMAEDRLLIRARYISDEVIELAGANELEDQCDALIDIIYFALGGFAELGVEPQRIFEIVHEANMAKLFEDGRPRHRPTDGKVAKPPHWKDPREAIASEIQQQLIYRGKNSQASEMSVSIRPSNG